MANACKIKHIPGKSQWSGQADANIHVEVLHVVARTTRRLKFKKFFLRIKDKKDTNIVHSHPF